jgi:hypothetical protein
VRSSEQVIQTVFAEQLLPIVGMIIFHILALSTGIQLYVPGMLSYSLDIVIHLVGFHMGERPPVIGQRHVLTEPEPGETLVARGLSEIGDITFGMFASIRVCMVVRGYHRHTIDKE